MRRDIYGCEVGIRENSGEPGLLRRIPESYVINTWLVCRPRFFFVLHGCQLLTSCLAACHLSKIFFFSFHFSFSFLFFSSSSEVLKNTSQWKQQNVDSLTVLPVSFSRWSENQPEVLCPCCPCCPCCLWAFGGACRWTGSSGESTRRFAQAGVNVQREVRLQEEGHNFFLGTCLGDIFCRAEVALSL